MFAFAISTKPAAISSRVRTTPCGAEPRSERVERALDPLPVERERKAIADEPPEREVDVGDGQLGRVGVPVAERAGTRARALGPDAEAVAVVAAERAAARGDGVDRQHRRADAHARGLGLVDALELGVAVSKRETSVEVPPMSKPIARVAPIARATCGVGDDAAGGRTGSRSDRGSAPRRSARRSTA